MLEVKSLTKVFKAPESSFWRGRKHLASQGDVVALKNVSFSLSKSEILGIIGESGSGKTTLAKVLLGLLNPTEGGVVFEGENIFGLSDEELRKGLRAKARMIFQHPDSALNPAFTVQMVIEQALSLYSKEPRDAWPQIAEELLGEVGLSKRYLQKYPSELSGGEKRRVGVCRALSTSPSMIIADEPVSGLDVTLQKQILELLLKLREERGLAILIITHNLSIVRSYCDKIGVMYEGELVNFGTYHQLVTGEDIHPYTRSLFASEYKI